MEYTIHPKRFIRFILINLFIALVVCLFLCFKCFGSWEGFLRIWGDLLYSFLISCLMSGGIAFIIRFSEKIYPWVKAPVKRFFFDLIAVTAYSFLGSLALVSVFSVHVWGFTTWADLNVGYSAQSALLPTVIALFITFILTSRAFLLEWRRSSIEAEQMKNERLKVQYQSLKDQLNPHFLFNSLNVLSNLVYENPDKANAFIEKLSRVYRYVLDVQNEELVTLDEEIAFAKSYLELQKIRFGDKLNFNVNVAPDATVFIPPLALQLLLENALKHNKATRESPLHIHISRKGEQLVVGNNLQKREAEEPPSGIGLTNIRERYRFFTEVPVDIRETPEHFTASLPLILNKNRA
jgi:sensor histidine kinase YesM